jgi:hypothetical protein
MLFRFLDSLACTFCGHLLPQLLELLLFLFFGKRLDLMNVSGFVKKDEGELSLLLQ